MPVLSGIKPKYTTTSCVTLEFLMVEINTENSERRLIGIQAELIRTESYIARSHKIISNTVLEKDKTEA